ncbi:hypothetical protein D3C76_1106300 [compost metagenome]
MQGQQTRHLREPDIPTDQQADAPYRGFEYRKAQVARSKPELFLVPQVSFAVVAKQALGAEQHGTVVKLQTVALGKAGNQIDLMFTRECRPGVNAWTTFQGFGMSIGFGTGTEGVAGVGQLGQDYQIGPFADRLFGEFQASA